MKKGFQRDYMVFFKKQKDIRKILLTPSRPQFIKELDQSDIDQFYIYI